MPIQIDNLEVVSLPPAEPAQNASAPTAAAVDTADQMRAWLRASTLRHDRLRAD